MVTAYDYSAAVHLDTAGIDICLVGDSASMVVHGHDTTLPITIDEMLVHCRAVARGATRPLLVGDLPFGTYESSTNQVIEVYISVLLLSILWPFVSYFHSFHVIKLRKGKVGSLNVIIRSRIKGTVETECFEI